MLTAIVTAALFFAATNIDDIFVLVLFFSQTSRSFRRGHVVAGQYLGFSAIVAISLLGFFGSRVLPRAWVGLLGFVPILIGIRRWIHRHDPPVHAQLAQPSGTASTRTVSAVTFANGGDNIGVYTPLFASSNGTDLIVTLLIFYILLAVWCFVAYAVTRHPAVVGVLARYGHVVVPVVFVGLGIYIIVRSGTLELLRF